MWRYASASTTGSSHLKSGTPCQDRHLCVCEGEAIMIAVADGAGSASMSALGAEIAVTTAMEHLRLDAATAADGQDGRWQDRVLGAANAARQAVLGQALASDRLPRDYACTLLLVVLTASSGAALQIGDGLIAYRDEENWGWLFWPQKGEYANTTHFLTDDNAERAFESVAIRGAMEDVAVMTDGLEGLALHFATRTIHEPFLEAVIAPLRGTRQTGEAANVSAALAAFLQSERIASRTDDDLTLVMATKAL
jgi:hypothetical protein